MSYNSAEDSPQHTSAALAWPSHVWRPAEAVDAVTVSNLHVTHRGVQGLPGSPRLLWGITPERTWNRLALTVGDVWR